MLACMEGGRRIQCSLVTFSWLSDRCEDPHLTLLDVLGDTSVVALIPGPFPEGNFEGNRELRKRGCVQAEQRIK